MGNMGLYTTILLSGLSHLMDSKEAQDCELLEGQAGYEHENLCSTLEIGQKEKNLLSNPIMLYYSTNIFNLKKIISPKNHYTRRLQDEG
jgi:hypothetical protein